MINPGKQSHIMPWKVWRPCLWPGLTGSLMCKHRFDILLTLKLLPLPPSHSQWPVLNIQIFTRPSFTLNARLHLSLWPTEKGTTVLNEHCVSAWWSQGQATVYWCCQELTASSHRGPRESRNFFNSVNSRHCTSINPGRIMTSLS